MAQELDDEELEEEVDEDEELDELAARARRRPGRRRVDVWTVLSGGWNLLRRVRRALRRRGGS